jgi:peptide/nickel transport system permease protein
MLRYLARRIAGTLVLLVLVVIVTFGLIHLAPGDTAQALAGQGGADARYVADLRHELGLDKPLVEQIGVYLGSVFRGDLGFSAVQGRPVLDVILQRLPATLLLFGSALLIATVGGVILGVIAAARRRTRTDTAISVASLTVSSLPLFWVGQILVGLLAIRLGWLPTGGLSSPGAALGGLAAALDAIKHLILPAGVLSLLMLGLIVRITRSAMIDVLAEDYIRVARARGIPERRLLFRHALPNALRPVVTVVTAELGLVLTGTVLVESVFTWPGLGSLLLDSVLGRDNLTLVGLLLFSAFLVATANLVADLLYLALDPRVRPR